ncbi:MAG: hypothetical protein JO269_09690 [Burkholderiaceae bacterium]|nr:hypothetical protein [Burkholderiaceae bacterium]
MVATTGIINSAINQNDPNAAQSSQQASSATVNPATPTPAPSTISNAPTALQDATANPTSSAAYYLNQLNSGATPQPSVNNAAGSQTQSSNSTSTSAPASSAGIVNSKRQLRQVDTGNTDGTTTPPANTTTPPPATPPTTPPATPPATQPTTPPATTPPATTPPGGNMTPVSAVNAANQIAVNYEEDFGRMPDQAGLQYWENVAAQNPNMTLTELNNAIMGGAQGSDMAAEGAMLAKGGTPSGIPASIPTNAAQLGNPTQLNVGPYQTVQGQLANIDDPNSPLMQQARAHALEQANASGLANSSMAITAGDAAAYNAALPIAEQDANTYENAAATNANTANQFAIANQTAQNTLTGQQLNAETSIQDALTAANTSIATNAASNQTQQAIATLQAQTNAMIQSSSSVANAGANYQSALNTIAQLNTDAQGKYNLELSAYNAYVQAVQTITASSHVPDVSNLLQFNQTDPSAGTVAGTGTDTGTGTTRLIRR